MQKGSCACVCVCDVAIFGTGRARGYVSSADIDEPAIFFSDFAGPHGSSVLRSPRDVAMCGMCRFYALSAVSTLPSAVPRAPTARDSRAHGTEESGRRRAAGGGGVPSLSRGPRG